LPWATRNDHLVIGRIVRFHDGADETGAGERQESITPELRPVGRLAPIRAYRECFAGPVAEQGLERRETRMHRVDERDTMVAVEGSGVVAAGDAKRCDQLFSFRLAKIGGFSVRKLEAG